MQKRLIRIIGLIMVIYPWIYVPSIYKEVLIMIVGIVLLFTTINTKKKAPADKS